MFNKTQKKIQMIKKEYECRQCHKVMCHVYIMPEDEDAFDDSYPCCWPCFLELCNKASKGCKK